VVWVDWCDADAFCKWSGKQLCGNLSGGPLVNDGAHLNQAAHDAWYAACSNNDALTYPYGNAHMPGACNLNTSGLQAVGAETNCTGGYTGLFDMLGNAWEHVNACVGNQCIVHGASFKTSGAPAVTCKNTIDMDRTSRFDDMGIRCCAYLP
jgi:formylglycine-generating enzyme required for sulfatase activity